MKSFYVGKLKNFEQFNTLSIIFKIFVSTHLNVMNFEYTTHINRIFLNFKQRFGYFKQP